MKKFSNTLLLLIISVVALSAQPNIQLTNHASGFVRPVDIAHCGDERLFIVEQRGIIWILDNNGNKLPNPFLDIMSIVNSNANERGLLGLAFHPNYFQNGYFYVNYTRSNGQTRIARYSVLPGNANQADPASEFVLLDINQPFSNHNGGCMKFGPDGYLYTSPGDGGSGGDPQNHGQNRMSLLGKMLRLDVDGGSPYSIPPDNPFVNDNSTRDEIWAWGLRNPWRFSFDRLTGDLWIGDVGQDAWEEINFQPASSPGGENYGWRCYEGNAIYNTTGCPPAGSMTFPVAVYSNTGAVGCSVTGGFVYRGCRYPSLYGHYLYADYCTGIFWSLTPDGAGGWINQQLADLNNFQFVSFGENKNGELFIAGLGNGIIYRLTETSGEFNYDFTITNATCSGQSDGSITVNFTGNNNPVLLDWNTGSSSPQLLNLPAGNYAVTITGGNGCTATETLEVVASVLISGEATPEDCPGDANGSISLSVSGSAGPPVVNWNDGSTAIVRTGLSAGSYSVTLTTVEGCNFSETYLVETAFDAPEVPVVTVNGSLLSSTGGYATYQWLLNGEPIAGADQQEYTAAVDGSYSVLVANNDGCTATSAPVSVTITGTVNLPGIESLRLTPNPFGQTLRLELTAQQPVGLTVQLKDMYGKLLLERKLPPQHHVNEVFDVQSLPSGTYILIVKTPEGEWSERVVKG